MKEEFIKIKELQNKIVCLHLAFFFFFNASKRKKKNLLLNIQIRI